ncbi:helix-turn-helix transcriptional regulator [Devosia sp.]|uniref:helix-turn-helix domain-containing protein n=1 Tax=Devosia sp. TaxID=1871048 RepID=UPI001AC26A8E|nr:helix-turn-helix transcriptional regulator [Devosia sp.]MBN9307697.1 helix-turn-helix transcriptional regulator [Devosia sp.]
MTRLKKSDFRPARERIDQLPLERRARIQAGAEKIVQAARLAEIRRALSVTQTDVSEKSGLKQAEVSRIENNLASVQLRTLERYIQGLGGTLKVVAEFPDGSHADIPLRSGRPVKSRTSMQPKESNAVSAE